jgi:hypothetical protein
MGDVKIEAEQPAGDLSENAAPKLRRPWRAPAVIHATVSREINKSLDYLPEGKLGSPSIIS